MRLIHSMSPLTYLLTLSTINSFILKVKKTPHLLSIAVKAKKIRLMMQKSWAFLCSLPDYQSLLNRCYEFLWWIKWHLIRSWVTLLVILPTVKMPGYSSFFYRHLGGLLAKQLLPTSKIPLLRDSRTNTRWKLVNEPFCRFLTCV